MLHARTVGSVVMKSVASGPSGPITCPWFGLRDYKGWYFFAAPRVLGIKQCQYFGRPGVEIYFGRDQRFVRFGSYEWYGRIK